MGFELSYGHDHFEPRPDSLFRVIFVCLGIAEIDNHPIARVRRHEAAEALYSLRNAVVVGRNDFAEVFRIHAG